MYRPVVRAQALVFAVAMGCHAHDRIIGLDGGKNPGAMVMNTAPNGTADAGPGGASASPAQPAAHDGGMSTGPHTPRGHAGAPANAASDAGVPSTSTQDSGAPSGNDSRDAATASAGDAGQPPATGCARLTQCCAQLPDAVRLSCELIATSADSTSCDAFAPLFCDVSPADAGAGSCSTLDDCCATLAPGQVRAACMSTAMNDVAGDCAQAADAYCPNGVDLTACITLSACCDGLPPPKRADCNAIVQAGLPSACQAEQTRACR
jgi:hypothetical protein